MSLTDVALVMLGVCLIVVGIVVLTNRRESRDELASYESDMLKRSSLLNQERIERINASRSTEGGQLIDRLRVLVFGFWLIVVGVLVIAGRVL